MALLMHLLHDADERGERRLDRRHGAEHVRLRGDPRAVQMVLHLAPHDPGLLDDFRCERSAGARRLVLQHCERRLQRVRKIADMGACALDDLAIGIDERIQVLDQRSISLG